MATPLDATQQSRLAAHITVKQGKTNLPCPVCGEPLMVRTNRRDGSMFLGCIRFPECRGSKVIDDETYKAIFGIERTTIRGHISI